MTATAHALVGGALAASIPNPAIGLTLATLSHPIMDMIPHSDFGVGWRSKTRAKLFTEASLDLAVGVTLAYLLFGRNISPVYFFGMVIAANLLDIIQAPYWFLHWNFAPFSSVYKLQHRLQGRAKLPMGIITQVVTIAVVVLVLQAVVVR